MTPQQIEEIAREIAESWTASDCACETHAPCKSCRLAEIISVQIKQAVNEAYEEAANLAETVRFSRICQDHGHEDGEIKWNFNGSIEIADAIRARKIKL